MSESTTSTIIKYLGGTDQRGEFFFFYFFIFLSFFIIGTCKALSKVDTDIKECDIKECDIEERDSDGHTALMRAAINGSQELATLLLDSGADINAMDEKHKVNILIMTVAANNLDVFKILLKRGVNLHVTNRKNQNFLHLIAGHGETDMCKVLLESVSSIDLELLLTTQDNYGYTPLHHAAGLGYLGICQLFVKADANINAICFDNGTPLHYAAMQCHFDICKLLVEAGADINATDNDNNTPLHLAGSKGSQDIFNYLIEKGADISIENDDGKLPKITSKKSCADELEYLEFINRLIMMEKSKYA
jgi:ankyrin repeat protein